MTHRTGCIIAALLAGPALTGGAIAAAQDSQFGIRGLGTPGRWESVRSRATGGAFGPFDPLSPLMEAALADIGQLTATAAGGTSNRDVLVGGTARSLRATRVPPMGSAGPRGRPLAGPVAVTGL